MIKLPKKDKYTVGLMTGSFHTDYSFHLADVLCKALDKDNIQIVLMQSLDAIRYLSLNSIVDDNFDSHYYSIFEYGKYLELDLLIVSLGTISAIPSSISTIEFFEPFKEIPTIVIEDDTPMDNSIYITVNNYQGMYACVNHLIQEHELKNILYVSGPLTAPDARVRLDSYKNAMKDNNLIVEDKMIAYGDFTDHVDNLIEELLDNNPDAQAICCANDEMAESAYRVLNQRGLIIGKDIMVTGFDDKDSAKYMDPPLTTVRQSSDKIAEYVSNVIDDLIAEKEVSSAIIDAELIIRESCGCDDNSNNNIDTDNISNEIIVDERTKMKAFQKRGIINSLLLRNLLSKGLTSQKYFERIGHIISDLGAKKAYICLTDKPIKLNKQTEYFLPKTLTLYLSVDNGSIKAKGFDEGEVLDYNQLSSIFKKQIEKGKQLAIFPLFYQNRHYGALFVELDHKDMFFYYTLSLELGTGLYFMQIELSNQKSQRELEEQNRILDYLASHDSLTSCYNRTEAIRLANTMMESKKYNKFVIVVADLDYLKRINDTFGHYEGDIAIKQTAEILKDALPDGGIIGRAGGDEFICFFPYKDNYNPEQFIQIVNLKCAVYNKTSDKDYELNISVGYHCFDIDDKEEIDTLFKKADDHLYVNKKKRKNSVMKNNDSVFI